MRIEILFFSVIATLVSAHDDISKNGDVVNLNEEDDYRLIEGDIFVPKESHLRGGILHYVKYWPYNDRYDKYIVTYYIDNVKFDAAKKYEIFCVMAFYEKHTNLKFIEKTNQHKTGWINITDNGVCISRIGMGSQAEVLSLNEGCKFAEIFHELGHAFGLTHEHRRPDRGVHVTVNQPGISYDITSPSEVDYGQITPYDIASIMHYESNLWYYTIQSLKFINPERAKIYKKVSIPSTCDMREINIMYPGEVKPGPCIPNQPENIYRPTRSCVRDKSKEDCDVICSTNFREGSEKGECEHPTLEELKTMKPLPQYAYTGHRALPLYT